MTPDEALALKYRCEQAEAEAERLLTVCDEWALKCKALTGERDAALVALSQCRAKTVERERRN